MASPPGFSACRPEAGAEVWVSLRRQAAASPAPLAELPPPGQLWTQEEVAPFVYNLTRALSSWRPPRFSGYCKSWQGCEVCSSQQSRLLSAATPGVQAGC